MNRLILLLFVFLIGCDSALIDSDPDNANIENFEAFWNEYDQHYSLFEVKGIDWDAVYKRNILRVETLSSAVQLFSLMGDLVLDLEDGFADITTSEAHIAYDYRIGYNENRLKNAAAYLDDFTLVNSALGIGAASLGFGNVKDSNLGYLRITTFGGPSIRFEDIDVILTDFEGKDGLIIDIRDNTGGSEENNVDNSEDNMLNMASRFVDDKEVFRKVKIRNGPDRNQFTDWIDDEISPNNDAPQFLKPIVILTNRTTFGAAEAFVLAVKTGVNTTVVGDVTGGGSGKPLYRELPNGWILRIPYSIAATPDLVLYEEVGLEPDFKINISLEEETRRIDKMMEKAIEILK